MSRRISERLDDDGEEPPLSVSIGIAESPADGTTASALLARADRELYAVKAQSPGRLRSHGGGGAGVDGCRLRRRGQLRG